MAEYYPLLAKAVSGLTNSTPEMRHAVYERARKALLGQLRALQPPIPEADIEKESQALDTAVARLEAEFAVAAGTLAEPDHSQVAPPPPANPEPPAPPRPGRPQPSSGGTIPGLLRPRVAKPASPSGDGAAPKTETEAAEAKDQPQEAASAPSAWPAKSRPEPQRPVAPQAPAARQGPKGLWIVLAVIGLIVVGVAGAAWKLRDRPEDLAKLKATPVQQETGGKIVGRVGENGSAKDVAAAGAGAGQSSGDAPAIPVTYRAALLVQAPEEQNKVKTYVGTVIWRLENVSNGPGEPLGTAIHANVDIPDDKLQASITLQKNVDASLPASHTMTIVFTVQPTTPTGTIKQIGVPQMRADNSPNGEALSGLPVPIMENSFLIGLTKGNAETANIELLKSKQWLDVPMLLANGHLAKLTLEKGVSGQRATDDAIASWQAQ